MASRANLPSLLLLPAPPTPASAHALSAAYRPSLRAAILRVRSSTEAAFLVIALTSAVLSGPTDTSRVLDWEASQSRLAGLYGLVAAVCAEEAIPSDIGAGPGSVDVRIVLVHDAGSTRHGPGSAASSIQANNTTVVDLETFACAYHPWKYIMNVDGEAGYHLRASFLEYAQGKQSIRQDQLLAVEGGISMNVGGSNRPTQSEAKPQKRYQTVCLGGTFDHLHPGHKLLLTAALLLLDVPKESSVGCKLIVGVTGDALLRNKKFAEFVQPWTERAAAVANFISSIVTLQESGWRDDTFPGQPTENESPISLQAFFRERTIQVHCVEIQDAFGPTITDEHVEALVVSGETRSGGKAVNDKRTGMGWKELDVYEVDVLAAEPSSEDATVNSGGLADYSSKISSSAIRQQRAQATSTPASGT